MLRCVAYLSGLLSRVSLISAIVRRQVVPRARGQAAGAGGRRGRRVAVGGRRGAVRAGGGRAGRRVAVQGVQRARRCRAPGAPRRRGRAHRHRHA